MYIEIWRILKFAGYFIHNCNTTYTNEYIISPTEVAVYILFDDISLVQIYHTIKTLVLNIKECI
jgi:hypothetical protein